MTEDLLAFAPAWLIELMRDNPASGAKRSDPVEGELVTEPGRNSFLTSLAGTMRRRGMGRESMAAALLVENSQRCDPPLSEDEVRGIAASIAKYDPTDSALDPVLGAWSEEYRKAVEDECTIVWASDITPTIVEWLWDGRIPIGKLTTFAGLGGIGKSFVLLDMAARITTGQPWPFSKSPARTGKVLFVSGEDDPSDTLVPRLIEMGGDRTKVAFLKTEVLNGFHLSHVKTLEKAYTDCGGNVRLVAIDPPTSFLGGVDDHKNSELRTILAPLARWAHERKLSVVFNTHFNKGGQNVEAVMRVMGSVAWVNAVRAAHAFTRDPEDKKRVLCLPMKSNLGPMTTGLAYRIAPCGVFGSARVEWIEEVEVTADEAIGGAKKRPREEVARDILVGMFRKKLEWPSQEFWGELRHAGISRNAALEAREALKIPATRKISGTSGDVSWIWWVPPDWPHLKSTIPTAPEEGAPKNPG